MRDIIFYTGAVAFASGIFIRSFFDVSQEVIALLLVLACALAILWCRYASVYGRVILVVSILCFGGALGAVRADIDMQSDHHPILDQSVGTSVSVEGIITREPDVRANTTQLSVRVTHINDEAVDAMILVRADRFPEFAYGDRIFAEGTLELPETFETDLGRTFNYPGYLAARNITHTLSFATVSLIAHDEGNEIIAALLVLKHAFMSRVETILPEPHAGLAEGLVLGVKRAIGEDLEEAFRIAGIIHIVVLSGYNVTIVAEAIMRLLSFWFLPRTRAVCGVLAIAAFALIAGLSATVVRASFMAVLVLVARVSGRIYDVMRALVFAGVCMLVINPRLLVFDPGFQLSFLATLGLIVLAPYIEERLSLLPTRFQVREFVTATISAQILVLPLLLYSMGELSIVSIIVNVLVLPTVPIAMLLVFISGIVAFVSPALATPVAFVAYIFLGYIIGIATKFAALPFAAVAIPPFPFWIVFVSYGVMAFALWYLAWHTKNRVRTATDAVPVSTLPLF